MVTRWWKLKDFHNSWSGGFGYISGFRLIVVIHFESSIVLISLSAFIVLLTGNSWSWNKKKVASTLWAVVANASIVFSVNTAAFSCTQQEAAASAAAAFVKSYTVLPFWDGSVHLAPQLTTTSASQLMFNGISVAARRRKLVSEQHQFQNEHQLASKATKTWMAENLHRLMKPVLLIFSEF